MKTLKSQINTILAFNLKKAFSNLLVSDVQGLSQTDLIPDLSQSTQPQFGHYQCNNAMRIAKKIKKAPREVANLIVESINQENLSNIIEKIEIAGPGFINIWISLDKIAQDLDEMLMSEKFGIHLEAFEKQKIVVDFSSPNTAKEMHVGHLRSTIIGDSLCRILEYVGHDVLSSNHIGVWGTAFGMLIAYIQQFIKIDNLNSNTIELSDLVTWYKNSKIEFDTDVNFKKQAQEAVVKLQRGDPQVLQLWQLICHISSIAYHKIYDLLDIQIIDRGESYYNTLLAGLVAELENKGLIALSEGAKCIYLEGFTNREGEPLPFMVQKADGGYNYSTTDLAALKHRVLEEKADRLIYVVDAGQAVHLKMLFAAAQKAGYYDPAKVRCEHVAFGVVLGSDGKKFKTRSGETVRLIDLLETAIERARSILIERQKISSSRSSSSVSASSISADNLENLDNLDNLNNLNNLIEEIAHILGTNAVKYADLSCNRIHDYVFSLDRMLRFEGNTAAFLMYAYVRIASIKRKIAKSASLNSTVLDEQLKQSCIRLVHPSEIALGLALRQFPEIIECVVEDLYPNKLCEYLYGVAEHFNAFFRDCRVEGDTQQDQRLKLCELTAQILKTGLELLGLKLVERM